MLLPVKDEIAHILFHIDHEDSGDPDPSQTAGVGRRAAEVRRLLDTFSLSDIRKLSRKTLLREMKVNVGNAPLAVELEKVDEDEEGRSLVDVLHSYTNSSSVG